MIFEPSNRTTNSQFRAKISEDEPRRVQLKEENDALRKKLFETKGLQVAALEEVEKLKAEKNNLIKRRVCGKECFAQIPHSSSLRKL